MNRRTEGLTYFQAIDGHVKNKVVEGFSEQTLDARTAGLMTLCQ